MQNIIMYKQGEPSWVRWIKKRIRNNLNFMAILEGPTGCLSEDTKLLGQEKTIGELYKSQNLFVNTFSITQATRKGNGAYYPIKSKSEIIPSGYKELYEIELENGEKVLATKEHKFFINTENKRIEKELSELKEGDKFVCYPKNYLHNFYNKAKVSSAKTRFNKFNNKRICPKCNNLFFVNFGNYDSMHKYCVSCRIKPKKRIDFKRHWYEWEDNLMRQFYNNTPKEKLMELLPLRNSWSGILHKAGRLKIRRGNNFRHVNNFTSKNNPMKNELIKKKAIDRINFYYKNHSSWNKGIKQWEGKEHPKGMLNKHHTKQTKEQISKSTSGELCIHWLGGKSFEPYDKSFNDSFKRYIHERDNDICQVCGNKGIVAHHIDYDKLNSTELNCIILCISCHSKTNFNRGYWKEYLSKLIEEKYVLLKN